MENDNSSPSTPGPYDINVHTYSFTDPSSAQVGLNVEFVTERANLQYAIKWNKLQITLN